MSEVKKSIDILNKCTCKSQIGECGCKSQVGRELQKDSNENSNTALLAKKNNFIPESIISSKRSTSSKKTLLTEESLNNTTVIASMESNSECPKDEIPINIDSVININDSLTLCQENESNRPNSFYSNDSKSEKGLKRSISYIDEENFHSELKKKKEPDTEQNKFENYKSFLEVKNPVNLTSVSTLKQNHMSIELEKKQVYSVQNDDCNEQTKNSDIYDNSAIFDEKQEDSSMNKSKKQGGILFDSKMRNHFNKVFSEMIKFRSLFDSIEINTSDSLCDTKDIRKYQQFANPERYESHSDLSTAGSSSQLHKTSNQNNQEHENIMEVKIKEEETKSISFDEFESTTPLLSIKKEEEFFE